MSNTILDFSQENGLVLCQNPVEARNNDELLYISDVSKLKTYAVLFRRFFRNTGDQNPYRSEPAVCIFKEEDIEFNSEKHIQLHAQLWSAGRNEVYIILGKSRIDIVINARKPAEQGEGDKLSVEKLKLGEVLKGQIDDKFSAYLFGSGTFWEQSEFQSQLDIANSPYIHLLRYLMAVRRSFLSGNKTAISLSPETIDKLLIVSILVKFLEEIKDDNGKHTLKSIYRRLKVTTFAEAVENGLILDVFDELAAEFNGKLFDNFSSSEKRDIRKNDLSLLSQFLTAKIDIVTNQFFIWEQYNFNYLPAEVISAIYENFIQAEAARKNGKGEKGVVYTPIHLVNFLVDEVMPLDKSNLFADQKFKVLDPTCGSGVFIVAAYKRLLQWWAINNISDGDIQYPSAKVAKRILEENIFGVDVKETAILVSILGLTTALLDKLSPKEIWNQLRFPDLTQKNLQCSNFFKWASQTKQSGQTFDLVIGNPPFNPETGVEKASVLLPTFIAKIDFKHPKIPRTNFALHFFEASMALTKRVCMIIPSNVLLYDRGSMKYRKQLFADFTVQEIYDFTHLRRDLFHKSADTPVVAIVAYNQVSNRQPINHTVVKRMVSSENRLRFEIDYYDRHSVPFDWAVDDTKQFIWKTNLLGGGRLFQLIYRLSLLPTLAQHIHSKKKKWKQIRGFEGGDKIVLKSVDRIVAVSRDGKPSIDKNTTVTTNLLKEKYMYEPPFMIIDQVLGEGCLPAVFVGKENTYTEKPFLYYNRDFLGISVPESDEHELKGIYELIRHKNRAQLNYQSYLLAKSSSSLVLTETDINQSEILDVPYPENLEFLNLTKTEKIIQDDLLKYYVHLGKSINTNATGGVFYQTVSAAQLNEYGQVLCDSLNSVYEKNNKSWQVAGSKAKLSFVIYQIGFGPKNKPLKNHLDDNGMTFSELLKNSNSNRGAIYNRVIRIYKHIDGYDCIFIIKPNTLRYWLKSIALRDADDAFVDLKQGGF
jgi:hypothetical protein